MNSRGMTMALPPPVRQRVCSVLHKVIAYPHFCHSKRQWKLVKLFQAFKAWKSLMTFHCLFCFYFCIKRFIYFLKQVFVNFLPKTMTYQKSGWTVKADSNNTTTLLTLSSIWRFQYQNNQYNYKWNKVK